MIRTSPASNEDKLAWCQHGLDMEHRFIGERGSAFSEVSIKMNPSKESDPYAYDMVIAVPCDLKTTKTPWRLAHELYGIESDYAVSINRKDLVRYWKMYRNIILLLDVNHDGYRGTHWTNLHQIKNLISEGLPKLHTYKNRINDKCGNAKESYIFDVRWFPVLG